MPQHQGEGRAAGRHRRAAPRHRAPSPLLARLPEGDRGRAALMGATLSAALAVGVAGGTAAAGADRSASSGEVATIPVSETPAMPVEDFEVTPFSVSAVAASPAQRKTRPAPVVAKATTSPKAAWVNPNPAGTVTSCYGERWGRLHAGVDIAGPEGSPILAAGAGVVVRAGEAEGYGNAVLIDHGNGYLTHYGHMSAITVGVGQHVTAGEQIGAEGSTGHSTGPHLHFEVHQGTYKNPIEPTRWLHDHGVGLPGCAAATS